MENLQPMRSIKMIKESLRTVILSGIVILSAAKNLNIADTEILHIRSG